MAGHWLRNGQMFAFSKQDLHAMYGEFLGTTMFLLLVFICDAGRTSAEA
jgi:hypothetical protein